MPATIIDEADVVVVYSDGWRIGLNNLAAYLKTTHYGTELNARATLTFQGKSGYQLEE